MKVMEARCPECGSPDVDTSFGNPLDGVKCWDCGLIYRLTESTGVEIVTVETDEDEG